MARKFTVNEELITKCLPTPPVWGHYVVEPFSKLVWAVWLVHDVDYDYACGKEVKTIHSFIKHDGSVMKPTNSKKVSSQRICHVANIPQSMNLTVITPKYTQLKTKE